MGFCIQKIVMFFFTLVAFTSMYAQISLVSQDSKCGFQYDSYAISGNSQLKLFPFSSRLGSYGFGVQNDNFLGGKSVMLSSQKSWINYPFALRVGLDAGYRNYQENIEYGFVGLDLRFSTFLNSHISFDIGLNSIYNFNKKYKSQFSNSETTSQSSRVVLSDVRNIDIKPGINLTYWLQPKHKVVRLDNAAYSFTKKKEQKKNFRKQIVYFDLNHLDFVSSNSIDTNVIFCTYRNDYGAQSITFELVNEKNKRIKKFELKLKEGMNFFKIPLTKILKNETSEKGFLHELDKTNSTFDLAELKQNLVQGLYSKINIGKISEVSSMSDLNAYLEKCKSKVTQGNILQKINEKELLGKLGDLNELKSLSDLKMIDKLKEEAIDVDKIKQWSNEMIDIKELKQKGLNELSTYIKKEKLTKADFLNNIDIDAELFRKGLDQQRLKNVFETEKKLMQDKIAMGKAEFTRNIELIKKMKKEKLEPKHLQELLYKKVKQSKDSCKVEQLEAYMKQANVKAQELKQLENMYKKIETYRITTDELLRYEKYVEIKEKYNMYATKYEKYKSYLTYCDKNKINRIELAKQQENFNKKISELGNIESISTDNINALKVNATFNSFTQGVKKGRVLADKIKTGGLEPGSYFLKYNDGLTPTKTLKINYQ